MINVGDRFVAQRHGAELDWVGIELHKGDTLVVGRVVGTRVYLDNERTGHKGACVNLYRFEGESPAFVLASPVGFCVTCANALNYWVGPTEGNWTEPNNAVGAKVFATREEAQRAIDAAKIQAECCRTIVLAPPEVFAQAGKPLPPPMAIDHGATPGTFVPDQAATDHIARSLFTEDHCAEIERFSEAAGRPESERQAHRDRVTNVMIERSADAWAGCQARAVRLLGGR